MDNDRLTVMVPPETKLLLKLRSASGGVSMGEYVRQVLEGALGAATEAESLFLAEAIGNLIEREDKR